MRSLRCPPPVSPICSPASSTTPGSGPSPRALQWPVHVQVARSTRVIEPNLGGGVELLASMLGQQHDPDLVQVGGQRP
jgi:hypothetical protein